MSTPINSIIFPGSPEKYMLRDCRATTSESGAATNNEFGFIKVGYQGNKKKVPVSIDEDGNAYVELTDTINSLPTSDVSYLHGNNRWLIFDFSNENRRGLKVKKGTKVKLTIKSEDPEVEDEIRWLNAEEDLHYDFSDAIENFDTLYGANGTDFYVYLVPTATTTEGEEGVKLVISMDNEYPSDVEDDNITYSTLNSRKIGQFHTLCNGVPAGTMAIVPTAISTTGESVTLMNYFKNQDQDFVNFYTKTVDANNTGSYYNLATVLHPLTGFNSGDILPESVCCLNFHPSCKNWDGMVYCNTLEKFVDIYLQSGTGEFTESKYGAVHTISRQWLNHQCDLQTVGKSLLTISEFMQAAMGSNERTAITGAKDWTTVGGHVDTDNRRMISFIGCEECCGYLWQWCRNDSEYSDRNDWSIDDGRGLMGQSSDTIVALSSGGDLIQSSYCGSRAFGGDSSWSNVSVYIGGRGIADLSIV